MKVTIDINGTPEEIAALAAGLTERRLPEAISENYIPASEDPEQDAERAEQWP